MPFLSTLNVNNWIIRVLYRLINQGFDRDPPVTCQSHRNSFYQQRLFCNLRPSQVTSERLLFLYLDSTYLSQSRCLNKHTRRVYLLLLQKSRVSISSLVKFQHKKQISITDIPVYFITLSLFTFTQSILHLHNFVGNLALSRLRAFLGALLAEIWWRGAQKHFSGLGNTI